MKHHAILVVFIVQLICITLCSSTSGHGSVRGGTSHTEVFSKGAYEQALIAWQRYQTGDRSHLANARAGQKLCCDVATRQRNLAARTGKIAGSDQLYHTLRNKFERNNK